MRHSYRKMVHSFEARRDRCTVCSIQRYWTRAEHKTVYRDTDGKYWDKSPPCKVADERSWASYAEMQR